MNSAPKSGSRRYSAEEWEVQKVNIERLYVTENRPLKDVIHILSQDFCFTASEKQLKSRLKKWGFDVKNIKHDTMVELARTRAKRHNAENKKSSFRVNKKPVDGHNIDRFLQRKNISEEELLAMTSPVSAPSPPISVFTPHSVRSPTPGPDFTARSPRSLTPGLNFQTLSLIDPQPPSLPNPLEAIAEEAAIVGGGMRQSSSSRASQRGVGVDVENVIVVDDMLTTSISDVLAKEEATITDVLQEPLIFSESPADVATEAGDYVHRPSPSCAWPTAAEESTQVYRDERERPARDPITYIWSCDECREEAGMTINIDHCPGCGHLRCSTCSVEQHKTKYGA